MMLAVSDQRGSARYSIRPGSARTESTVFTRSLQSAGLCGSTAHSREAKRAFPHRVKIGLRAVAGSRAMSNFGSLIADNRTPRPPQVHQTATLIVS